MTQKLLITALFAGFGLTCNADDTIPGPPQKTPIALIGGTVHPVSGPTIEGGTVVFEKGRITFVGKHATLPNGVRRVDVTGKHVYPGLFEAHSQLGLTEISSTPSTVDSRETGDLNPNVRANRAVNPDSALIPVTRSNGVLLAVTAPSGGVVSGRASVMQLDGWTYEDMTLKADAVLQVNWPRMAPVFRAEGDEPPEEQNNERDEALTSLRKLFSDTRAYIRGRAAGTQKFDIRLESMRDVVSGRVPLLVRADDLAQIQSAVGFAVEQKVRMTLLGGYDAPLCADLLKKHKVAVIVSAVHRRPRRRNDDYDAPYTLPQRLRRAGIRYCISGTDRSDTWNARNLPYEAARAVGYGLDHDEALRAITLYPAMIFGVAERVGSLETGKDATLFVSTGDPLETDTQITQAWIQGRTVDMNDKHKRLYRKYKTKYERQARR